MGVWAVLLPVGLLWVGGHLLLTYCVVSAQLWDLRCCLSVGKGARAPKTQPCGWGVAGQYYFVLDLIL